MKFNDKKVGRREEKLYFLIKIKIDTSHFYIFLSVSFDQESGVVSILYTCLYLLIFVKSY